MSSYLAIKKKAFTDKGRYDLSCRETAQLGIVDWHGLDVYCDLRFLENMHLVWRFVGHRFAVFN